MQNNRIKGIPKNKNYGKPNISTRSHQKEHTLCEASHKKRKKISKGECLKSK